MTTKIWIEPRKLTKRGMTYRTGLAYPIFEALCESTLFPVLDSCRTLVNMGLTGPYEAWKPGIPYPCMVGDIEGASKYTVEDGKFRKYKP